MRIYGDPERAKANLRAGRESARLARVEPATRPPDPGTLLKTIRVTDHITGQSYTLTLHQGERLNNVEPRIFGRRIFRSGSVGFDEFFREMRRKWKLRWFVIN